ncbi:MAG: efflux RND transporter periplasmic adaptor subunit [Deltaproteobacteria bacterium]|nr:efflux RND transporter periplasmic adaptor subunit [Deltaproteobacteria bacterium]
MSFRLFLLGLISVAAGLLLLASCSGKSEQEGASKAAPVTAEAATLKNVPVVVKAIGAVEPYNTVSVRARVGGEITAIAFREGQEVERGDLLFNIDPHPYQAALDGALADLARDQAKLRIAEDDVRRYKELIQKDYVTSQQYDQVVANAESLKATVAADEAAVKTARLNLGYCTVQAPISGRTGDVLVQVGNMITAYQQPVTIINQITPIYVSFSVPEEYLADIRRYAAQGTLEVEAALAAGAGPRFRGDLSFINNEVDGTTGTILLKATFPNRDRVLWPGQFVDVTLTLATTRNAVVAPSQAIQRDQQGEYVFVVKPDMTVESRAVETGQQVDGQTVIRKGVEAGERVVTDGQLRLRPGVKVTVTSEPAPSGASTP